MEVNDNRSSLGCRRFFCKKIVKVWNDHPAITKVMSNFHRFKKTLHNLSLMILCRRCALMFFP